MNLRLTLLPVHRWVGLTLGMIALVSAATGAGMAFRKSLDPLIYARQFHAAPCARSLPLDAFVAAARAAHPKGAVDYVRVRGGEDAPVAVRFGDKDTLYLDRCSGRTVAHQNRYEGLFGWLERIHRMAFFPNGGWIMGLGALGLLFLLAGLGIYLWWPRKPKRFRQGFALDRRLKGRMFTLGLHRTVGAWVAPMVLISALTGLPNAFDGLKDWLVSLGATTPQAHLASLPPAGPRGRKIPLQSVWSTVVRLSPNPREVLVHLARRPADPIEAFIIDADAPHANARTYLYLDAYSGRVLRYAPYRQSGFGSRLYYWMLSVHTGEVGGVLGQALLFLGAIGIPGLAYTGASSYLRRRFAKPKRRTRPSPSPTPAE